MDEQGLRTIMLLAMGGVVAVILVEVGRGARLRDLVWNPFVGNVLAVCVWLVLVINLWGLAEPLLRRIWPHADTPALAIVWAFLSFPLFGIVIIGGTLIWALLVSPKVGRPSPLSRLLKMRRRRKELLEREFTEPEAADDDWTVPPDTR